MVKKKSEHGEPFRNRNMLLRLYPDDLTHVGAMDKIKENGYDYAAILHDKDVAEDSTLKKPHWHVVLSLGKHARWNTAVCKELGIDARHTEEPRNLNNSLMYLIHANDPDKHQYDPEEVLGPMKTRLKGLLNSLDKTEGEKVVELIDFIKRHSGALSVTDFATYCAKNGYWSEFRRSGAIFCRMIDEKNKVLFLSTDYEDYDAFVYEQKVAAILSGEDLEEEISDGEK